MAGIGPVLTMLASFFTKYVLDPIAYLNTGVQFFLMILCMIIEPFKVVTTDLFFFTRAAYNLFFSIPSIIWHSFALLGQ